MRKAKIRRTTKETDVRVTIDLDGKKGHVIDTTIPFLDHMLSLMCHHGDLDLTVKAAGDTQIDYHHLMEDIGISIGAALAKALGAKEGIGRYGFSKIPMDETLAEVVVDLSGRPFLVYNISRKRGKLKDLPVSLFEDFFRAFATHAMMTIHINLPYGRDLHHIYESVFKAFGRALNEAVTITSTRLPSTKGHL